jgi:adenine deaminase
MATVRIIEMVTDLVTREHRQAVPVINAEVKMDAANDILKVAAIDRRHVPGKTYTGLIKGFGLQSGAFACSAGWDSSDIIMVGADETDMAAAVNRIKELRGGVVVCENGNIQAEIPMPIFGIMSTEPMESIARSLTAIKDAVSRLGVGFPDPILSLVTLTGAAIPYLRICEEGLVNLKDGRTVGLFVK